MISFSQNRQIIEEYCPPTLIKKALHFQKRSYVYESINNKQPFLSKVVKARCSVIFSDISGFSTTVNQWPPEKIKEFLDNYYHKIFPIIIRNGGTLDQIAGDGITAVFAKELNSSIENTFDSAFEASNQIVEEFKQSPKKSTKVAIHEDEAVISPMKTKGNVTVVGNIMTTVHRIESVAKDESINLLKELALNHFIQSYSHSGASKFTHNEYTENLKGMDPNPKILWAMKKNPNWN